MKKIGIITLYDDINIGNKLQNFAVQTYFESMGFDCKTIPHWEMAHKEINFQNIKMEMIKRIGFPKKSAAKMKLREKRKKLFKLFSVRYIKLGACVKISNLPSDFANQYDYFVVGSDQVWHNWTKTKKEVEYFFLHFAKKNQRLTISPSFGKSTIEPEFLNDYRKGLLGFPVLTCREEQGADLIKSITNQETTVLLDPTMLVSEGVWYDIERKPDREIPSGFILVYALGQTDKRIQKFIKDTAETQKLEIVDIYDTNRKDLYLTTPDEFIYYIHHAKLVVTDSFHASVFSILFNTDFVVFDRQTSSMGNMSSRLDTLLDKFYLSDRKIQTIKDPFGTDFSKVSEVLKVEREKAKKLYEDTFELLNHLT